MENCQTFQDIDAAKWARIKSAVKAKSGIDINTDSGIASAKGIKLQWAYAEPNLTVTLVSRSFFDPQEGKIDADIAEWILGA